MEFLFLLIIKITLASFAKRVLLENYSKILENIHLEMKNTRRIQQRKQILEYENNASFRKNCFLLSTCASYTEKVFRYLMEWMILLINLLIHTFARRSFIGKWTFVFDPSFRQIATKREWKFSLDKTLLLELILINCTLVHI